MKYFILGAIITFLVMNGYLYTPKNQVKRLWKRILSLTKKLRDLTESYPKDREYFADIYNEEINRAKKLIKAILDYYFDPEGDREFIEKHSP